MGLFMAVPTCSQSTLIMGTLGSFISGTEGWIRREEYLKSGFEDPMRRRGKQSHSLNNSFGIAVGFSPPWSSGLGRQGERDSSHSVAAGFGFLLPELEFLKSLWGLGTEEE
jgi:hypothetical protein